MNSAFAQKLEQVEVEMKRIGFWQPDPPDLRPKYLNGELRTYMDAPSFEVWLQVVFLPNARHAVETNSLPADSHVGEMAMRHYDHHTTVPEAHGLMRLLYEFDELVRNHKK